MSDRRSFLKYSSTALLGLVLPEIDFSSQEGNQDEIVDRSSLSWEEIRALFPMEPDVHYLNNGTMGPSPHSVIDAIVKGIHNTNSRGSYGGGEKSALSKISNLVGVNSSEIALTHNVTEGINIATWGIPLGEGDEVILTDQEHVGNGLPWLYRARKDGFKVRIMSLGNTADETLENLKKVINPRTRVIAVPHIPCTNGQVLPIKEICLLARSKGILSIVDGAHGTGMFQLDLKDMACDVYASCCHKWLLGPKGTGYMYVRQEFQDELKAYFVGGLSGLDWSVHGDETMLADTFTKGAHKYFYGTQSSALYKGVSAAVDFHQSIGIRRIENRILDLNNFLYKCVKSDLENVQFFTPGEKKSRSGVLAFKVPGKDNYALKNALHKKGYVVRYVGESGLNCLRVSTHIYNSEEQIKQFVRELKALL